MGKGGDAMSALVLPRLFGRVVRCVHFVGVGGMGAGPLAVYLSQLGFSVSGEDDGLTAEMGAILGREGVRIGTLPADGELVVYSSAISPRHPAYQLAARTGLPLVRRGELLAEVTRPRKLIGVCGSHGKTTTTAMLIATLRQANFPAGYILGGLFADDTPPARVGSNDWVVAEIDESDGTIEHFAPQLTVVVNLDWDHPDHYREQADLERTFADLVARTRAEVLINADCPASARVTAKAPKKAGAILTFGRTGDFHGTPKEEKDGGMTLGLGGRFEFTEAVVRTQGDFNATNATAALAAAQLAGAGPTRLALAGFPGVKRRQTILQATAERTVIEDYAHHPAEVRALLCSLRRRVVAPGRLVVVFQPHRYSRTAQFKAEFADALAAADSLHLMEVYSAGEAPVAGGTAADLYEELKRRAPKLPVSQVPAGGSEFHQSLSADCRSGDWVAFIGAGDIDRRAREWLAVATDSRLQASRWDEFHAALTASVSAATRLSREEPLARKTTLRVGGAARVFAEPASVVDLQALLRAAAARGVKVFVLGRGSNLIVPDEGVDGLVISLGGEAWANFEPRGDGRVWAGAGLRLKNLCGLAAKAGLVGFEFLEGIPGSVGGALRMNAGAMGGWMFDVVEAVELISLTGDVTTLARGEMHVAYRHCAELRDAIALGALLRPAAAADTEAVKRQMDAYARKRHESQPREPSAGCIFRNPAGDSAGRLIDASGLKGERVGDAEVSTVHANFIVNRGRATGRDVLELVRRVRARVRQDTGVELEPEVLLYGRRWEDVL